MDKGYLIFRYSVLNKFFLDIIINIKGAVIRRSAEIAEDKLGGFILIILTIEFNCPADTGVSL